MSAPLVIINVGRSGLGAECRCLYNQTNKPLLLGIPGAGVTLISPYEAVKVFTSDPSSIMPPPGVVLAPCSSPGPWQDRCQSVAKVFDWTIAPSPGSLVPVYADTSLFFVGPGSNDDGTFDLTSIQLYDGSSPLGEKIPLGGVVRDLRVHYIEPLQKILAVSKSSGSVSSGVQVAVFNLDGSLNGSGIIPYYGMGATAVYGDRLLVAYNDSSESLAIIKAFSIAQIIGSGDEGSIIFSTNVGYIYPNLVVQREGTVDYLYIPVLQNGVLGVSPSIFKLRYSDKTNEMIVELDELELTGTFVNVSDREQAWNFFSQYRYLFDLAGFFGAIVLAGPDGVKVGRTSQGIDSNWRVADLADPEGVASSIQVLSLGTSPLTGTITMFVVEDRGAAKYPCIYFLDFKTGLVRKECG